MLETITRRLWPFSREKIVEENKAEDSPSSIFLDRGDVFKIGQRIAVLTGAGISLDYPDPEALLDYKVVDNVICTHYQTPLRNVARVKKDIIKISNFETDPSCQNYLETIQRIKSDLAKIYKKTTCIMAPSS